MKKTISKTFRSIIALCLSIVMCLFSTTVPAFAENIETDIENIVLEESGTKGITATTMYLGTFSFTGQNTGVWRTVPGNHVRMKIKFKPIDGITYSTNMYVDLCQYPNVYIGSLTCRDYMTTPDADGYYTWYSPYFSI